MWFINDQLPSEGTQLESLTSLYDMKQLISEPIRVLEKSFTCIDLVFTYQPNHLSLHSKRHHQGIYAKLNLILTLLNF